MSIGSHRRNVRVVVLTDTAALSDIADVLRRTGHDVVVGPAGAASLALVDAGTDVAILDGGVEGDVVQTCRRLRARADLRQLSIVHLSPYAIGAPRPPHEFDAGADAYLTHPVHPQVLLATVRTLLRARDAEHALRTSEARFRSMFDQAPCGIGVLDRELRFLAANPLLIGLLQRDAGALLGRSFLEFADEPDIEAAEVQDCLEAGTNWTGAIRMRAVAGEARELEWNVSPRLDSDEVLCIVIDVTERARLEAERAQLFELEREARNEAERIARVKDEFLATLSHELRNPLAPLKNSLNLLRLADAGSAPATKAREVMARQVDHLTRLVDDLVDVSRITRGLVTLERQRVGVRTVLDMAIEASQPRIEAAGHHLELDLDEAADADLSADPLRLAQVLTNILNNAAKYTPRGGRIGLSVRGDRERIDIAVSDTGIGIPRHMLARIFDMFIQVHPTGPQAAGGLGIGLTLVKRLVEMHDGRVSVSSAGPGLGSRFVVSLPRPQSAPEPAPAPQQGAAALPPRGPLRAVVIDDNRDAAESLRELLIALGHDCESHFDGVSGIRAVEAAAPDLVFIDIGMPGMDGHEVATRLKSLPRTRHIPLFALTGWDQSQDRQRSLACGFERHLTKPLSLAELQQVIGEATVPAPQR